MKIDKKIVKYRVKKPEETAKRLKPGPVPGEQVLYTGDLGMLDDDGYLTFIGRMDDIIKSRGEKVAPKEVESALVSVPGVSEKNLKVHLDEEQLLIEGRVDGEPTDRSVQREYRLVDYRRAFVVPNGIDHARISAELKAGVLWLHMPKSEAVKPRRIEVKTS